MKSQTWVVILLVALVLMGGYYFYTQASEPSEACKEAQARYDYENDLYKEAGTRGKPMYALYELSGKSILDVLAAKTEKERVCQ